MKECYICERLYSLYLHSKFVEKLSLIYLIVPLLDEATHSRYKNFISTD